MGKSKRSSLLARLSTASSTSSATEAQQAELTENVEELARLTRKLKEGYDEIRELRQTLIDLVKERNDTMRPLVEELQSVEHELLSQSAKTLPEWVASVDPARSKIYYINTKSQVTSWDRPENFDGTFVVIDDDTGLVAHSIIEGAVKQ